MKKQINKTVVIIMSIITMMFSLISKSQTITLDSNRTINVLTDFLSVKEKFMNYNHKDTTKFSILWKDKKSIGFINETDPEKKRFWINYKGINTHYDHAAKFLIRKNVLCPAWTVPTIKIKKRHPFEIAMTTEWLPVVGNKKWFFIVDETGNGGFYIKNKDGNICIDGEQVSVMTPEEMQYFGNELYKLLLLVCWIKQKSSCKCIAGFFYIYNKE